MRRWRLSVAEFNRDISPLSPAQEWARGQEDCLCRSACLRFAWSLQYGWHFPDFERGHRGRRPVVKGEPSGNGRIARASWYGPGFHGRKTASGERFNAHALTAAHRTLPFGTRVHVRNTKNGKSVVVRINDRGPFHRGREIDLSHGAARAIGMGGIGTVTMVVLGEKRG
mgnify:CR=1 FL=1